MPANASTPYYPSDWRGDPGVQKSSIGARGLWHEMYVLMMLSEDFGHLVVAGDPLTEDRVDDIAEWTRTKPAEVRRFLPELKKNRVYSVDDRGVIYCRKLVAMAPKRKANRENGAKGGAKTAQANAQARALAKSLEQNRLSESAQTHTLPNHNHSPSGRDSAGAREAVAEQADEFSDYVLDQAIQSGFPLGSWKLNPVKWRTDNRAASLRMVSANPVEQCRTWCDAWLAAIKRGAITSRIISVAALESKLTYREVADVKRGDSGPSFDEMMGVA